MKDCYTLADLRNWETGEPPIRLGVVGDPIAHSLSPRMQNAALRQCALPMRYAAFRILPNELSEALAHFVRLGFIGLNLTRPHKTQAAELVEELEPLAREIGAINTIRIANGRMIGSNTDGLGFSRAIREEFSAELRELRVLVLGASGGAGRAIARQCAFEKSPALILANRDFPPTESLDQIDLLVNATPLQLSEIFPTLATRPRLMIYDLNYNAPPTAGWRMANGLSMLLHQGALAFETWFNRSAPIETMRAALL